MENQPPTQLEIERGLQEIRVRWRLFWFLAASFLIVFLIFSLWAITDGRWHKVGRSHLTALLGSSVVVNIAWCRAILCRCPRCGQRFYLSGSAWPVPTTGVFAGKCVHCDLKLRPDKDNRP